MVDEIKQQLENTMGKDEFQRQLNRQRSLSMSGSQNGDGTRSGSISRQVFFYVHVSVSFTIIEVCSHQ